MINHGKSFILAKALRTPPICLDRKREARDFLQNDSLAKWLNELRRLKVHAQFGGVLLAVVKWPKQCDIGLLRIAL